MPRKPTNNLDSKFSLSVLNTLAESMHDKKLKEPYLLVLQLDKRTMTKKERESYSTRYIESYYPSAIDSIFLQPNVSKFTIHCTSRCQHGTFSAVGRLSNLTVDFTVDATEKNSKYHHSTYRVVFKNKESLLRGLQVYTALAIQLKDKILRRKLRAYFTSLRLL